MDAVASTSDPILAVIKNWRDAKRTFEEGPRPPHPVGPAQAYGEDVVYHMRHAPVAQTREGAIAALEVALEEASFLLLDPMNRALMRSALGFLQMFEAPAPRPATRAELEAYREWLNMEGRLLGMELYPEMGDDADRLIPCTPAGDLHFPPAPGMNWTDLPSPSTRAVAVLNAVGADFHKIEERARQNDECMRADCIAAAQQVVAAEKAGVA